MRKRKSKFTWVPTLGNDIVSGELTYGFAQTRETILPQNSNADFPIVGQDLIVSPVVADATFQASDRTDPLTLRDRVEGQDWLLKRIVGSIFVATCVPDGGNADRLDAWQAVYVTVGFLVARAGDLSPGNIDLSAQEADPQSVDNTWNPWIWRRSWLLGVPGITNTSEGGGYFAGDIANSNMAYGDMRSGPHIDSKVSRRIRKEHRLWLAVRATGFDPANIALSGSLTNPATVSVITDLRVLGAMRRSQNVSSF